MRLRLFSAVSIIMLVLALVLVACGGGESSASTGGTGTSSSSLKSSYKPSVKLVCVGPPCGSYPPRHAWHGTYYAEKTNFPANVAVVITATYPNGQRYPFSQYSYAGELYGIRGNVEYTDEYGQLPDFKWAALNENGPVDPQGVYHLTFRFMMHGQLQAAHASFAMGNLP